MVVGEVDEFEVAYCWWLVGGWMGRKEERGKGVGFMCVCGG